MRISVVIPTYNEAAAIGAAIEALGRQGFGKIIVADGGSEDDTRSLARATGSLVIESIRGRGAQMNAGAARASGELLLFVHADTVLPDRSRLLIEAAMAKPGVLGGAFHLRFDSSSLMMRIQSVASNVRSYYAVPFGDQALFVRKEFFFQTGGFISLGLMEDVEFARRMKRHGRLTMIRTPVTTSARRYRTHGFLRTAMTSQLLLAAFYLGVSPERLARFYRYRSPASSPEQ
jgi:rSAM/selenodomain-associated transferase 2